MASVVATDLSVSFAETETETEDRIILQQMSKRLGISPIRRYGDQDIRGIPACLQCRSFCNTTLRYTATVGTIEVGKRYPQKINSESISFSDSASATLSFPGAYDVSILQQVLMRRITRNNQVTIEPVSTTLVYDAETESVVTADGLPVYGKAAVSYSSIYETFYYYPFMQDFSWRGGGPVFNLGSVFAYNNTTVETLDIELDTSSSKDWVEYARVTSKIVLDPQGVWEFPTNWESTYKENLRKVGLERKEYDSNGRFYYNGGAGPLYTTEEVDGTNCFVDTRVHCIIDVNSIGQLQYKDHNNGGDGYWAWYAPYFGDSNYDPTYEILFADPPGGAKASSAEEFRYDLNHRTWRDAFLDVDKSALIEKLQNEYPGATSYSRSR